MPVHKTLTDFELIKQDKNKWSDEPLWWVLVEVHIKEVATGEVRVYATEEPLELCGGEYYLSVFNWEENNYACDCNREIFFNRVKGIEIENQECSDGRFLVNLVNPKLGETYYREFEN